MEMFPQNSWKVIDQWLQLFQPLLILVCLTKTTCRISIFPTGYILPPVGIPFGYLTFQKSIRKNFSTLHWYTCSDTVNTIVIFEIIVVLKTNYLHKQNGFFFKFYVIFSLVLFFVFLNIIIVTCISIFLPYQISSPSMHIYFGVTLNGVACLCWEGRWNSRRCIKYLVTSLITRTNPMDIWLITWPMTIWRQHIARLF